MAGPAATDLTSTSVIGGLAALAQETRLALFRRLVKRGRGGESAGQLARQLGIPPQTLSFHLKELTGAGLLRSRREGRHIYYAVDFDHAQRLVAYLSDACCSEEGNATQRPKGARP